MVIISTLGVGCLIGFVMLWTIFDLSGFANSWIWALVIAFSVFAATTLNLMRIDKRNRKSMSEDMERWSKIKATQRPKARKPEEFEEEVAEIFRRYGYKVSVTPYQGDHGVDIKVITPTEYGIVQCKMYGPMNKVGEPAIRDFYGTMQHEHADVGYIVTTSDFTEQAYTWAKGKKIVLVNGYRLERLREESSHLAT
ncbi:restriction endonuclease [Alicyclobacillus dauci]|uniref:Restriction endonuclease n=1 Tax=Alicyclobacillus dauci TaxID=1475485 RepID=A0ABY6YWX3_9BACL|nr:restriction endonuclease [Alicyclobacillus dauci]WAH35052.1 restriction endonuclease [Alicyclobacillus dauci]